MASTEAGALFRALDPVLWIVTARAGDRLGGLLATFVNSASIVEAAPRVVVGIAKQHRTWELIEESGAFALHLLRDNEGQHALAARFGLRSAREIDKFAELPYHFGTSGSPILDDAAGWLDCRVEARFDTGDRTLYLGTVVDARTPPEESTLRVKRWIDCLGTETKAKLGDLYRLDAAIDAEAIRAWRARHSPS